ncbi:MAG: type IV conjugative transfer system protein TraE [Alphaproteobacteria bacterium]
MKWQLAHARLQTLLKQRNILTFWCALFGIMGVLEAIVLLIKEDRIILVPPELNQRVWVEKGRVSEAYLEEMALFFIHLALDVNPLSAAYQRDVFLRYALPHKYGHLKAQLLEDEARLSKENLSTIFRPSGVIVNRSKGWVDVSGDFIGIVGEKRIFQIRETYRVQMHFSKGNFFLEALQCVRSERPENVHPKSQIES